MLILKNLSASARDSENKGLILNWEESLEEEMATHSSNLVWRIPWTEEPGRLQSMRPQTVKTQLSTHTIITSEVNFFISSILKFLITPKHYT